jgi:hypothetical protein
MTLTWAYGDTEVAGHRELLACYPEDEFNSPFRSTVPHLAFWQPGERTLLELCRSVGAEVPDGVRAAFEYQVRPRRGRGKASHTDLMLTWSNHCAAIEAKYREPLYETVGDWLNHGNRENRLEVLRGWCELISLNTESDLTPASVGQVTYQVLHRAASACSPKATVRYLIYEGFDLSQEKVRYYQAVIGRLIALLRPSSLRAFLLNVPVTPSPAYAVIKTRWSQGVRDLHREIVTGLGLGKFMSFGKPGLIEIR